MGQVTIVQKIGAACFLIVWCTFSFGMSVVLLEFNQPGIPTFIAIIPLGMGFLGILHFISQVRTWRKISEDHDTYHHQESWTGPSPPRTTYKSKPVGYPGDYVVDEKSYRPKPVYRLPPQCPSCNADISSENVGWVGPLQARCPWCFKIIDLDEHYK